MLACRLPLVCLFRSAYLSWASGSGKAARLEEGGGGGRVERWERLALAAAQQSLRAHGLKLQPATPVSDVARLAADSQLALLAAAGAPPLREVVAHAAAQQPAGSGSVLLIVGPPGDFTPAEVRLLADAGARPVGLGDLRLRTETAALSLLAGARLLLD